VDDGLYRDADPAGTLAIKGYDTMERICNHSQQSRTKERQDRSHGQSLLEFALTMPLLLALLIGIMLLAIVGFSYVSITSGARMGARHMMSYPVKPRDPGLFATANEEITYVITTAMPFVNWQRATITITPPVAQRLSGAQMQVRISYNMNLPTVSIPNLSGGDYVLLPPIILNTESRMRLD
jgi:Flp pilus assembly protein TadG